MLLPLLLPLRLLLLLQLLLLLPLSRGSGGAALDDIGACVELEAAALDDFACSKLAAASKSSASIAAIIATSASYMLKSSACSAASLALMFASHLGMIARELQEIEEYMLETSRQIDHTPVHTDLDARACACAQCDRDPTKCY